MSWFENNRVDYIFGFARNKKLRRIIGAQMHEATEQWKQTAKPARVFSEFSYQTNKTKKGGWDRERRVVAKAEYIDGKENPRFVVTSLTSEEWAAQSLYEKLTSSGKSVGKLWLRGEARTCVGMLIDAGFSDLVGPPIPAVFFRAEFFSRPVGPTVAPCWVLPLGLDANFVLADSAGNADRQG